MTEAELRRDARWMLDAGVRAVEPEGLVRTALESTGSAPAQTRVVAIGKAAAAMARGAKQSLGDAFSGGIVIAPAALVEQVPDGYEAFGGGHPEPNAAGVQGAEAIRRLASGLGQDDQLLVLISGGGSALMTLPPSGTTLEDLQQTTRLLLRAGATIQELNAVRKHLDEPPTDDCKLILAPRGFEMDKEEDGQDDDGLPPNNPGGNLGGGPGPAPGGGAAAVAV